MRMMKCYLATDREGHYVTAEAAMSATDQIWSCASCGCRLVLHGGIPADPAWFEHDQRSVAEHLLMNCAHLDPQVKADIRHNQLRRMVNGLDVPVRALSWYCTWCDNHYQGGKLCTQCGTGIYSIEEANWQANYDRAVL
ncbi:hypothetical protein C2125_06420 [Rahnella aquatilis]|nr:putative zinc ribbon protein [Rahnella aquatilis]RBQ35311.1 hypothetical protein C2125_06420 [Rahnella aquatilis]